MNLIHDAWLSVRRSKGTNERIAPWQLTEGIETNPILDLETFREDFKPSLFQFLTGLFQSAGALPEESAFDGLWNKPPAPEELRALLEPLAPSFELFGEGPRFMQDLDPLAEQKPLGLASLLPETPGEKTVKDGTTLFNKPHQTQGFCSSCAAAALFNLQLNAPSGGAGHRVGLRGGGPLNSMVLPAQAQEDNLWRRVLLNLLAPLDLAPEDQWEDLEQKAPPYPWTAPTQTSEKKQSIASVQAHPLHAFWAMPRRIRLEAPQQEGPCGLCGQRAPLVPGYRTKPHGYNYAGSWQHPYSPNYQSKDGDWLPYHPQPTGLGYDLWPTLTFSNEEDGKNKTRIAKVVQLAAKRAKRKRPLRLWPVGYDFDNMKLRGWHDHPMPWVEVPWKSPHAWALVARKWVEAARLALYFLRRALIHAQFGEGNATQPRGFGERQFWDATETPYFELLEQLAQLGGYSEAAEQLGNQWLKGLQQEAMRQFELWAEAGPIKDLDLYLVYTAKVQLQRNLNGPKIKNSISIMK